MFPCLHIIIAFCTTQREAERERGSERTREKRKERERKIEREEGNGCDG